MEDRYETAIFQSEEASRSLGVWAWGALRNRHTFDRNLKGSLADFGRVVRWQIDCIVRWGESWGVEGGWKPSLHLGFLECSGYYFAECIRKKYLMRSRLRFLPYLGVLVSSVLCHKQISLCYLLCGVFPPIPLNTLSGRMESVIV